MTEHDDDWADSEPEYFNEPMTCRHGMPGRDCEWCEEERDARGSTEDY